MTVNQLIALAAVIVAVAGICVTVLIGMDSKAHARMDRMEARMVRMEADIGDLKVSMAEAIAILERIEHGQTAGTLPAKPSARQSDPVSHP